MEFNEYQEQTKKTAMYMKGLEEKYPDMDEGIRKMIALSYCGLGLGETGEVQGKIKKIIRDNRGEITEDNVKELKKELGDALWYIAQTAITLGINLEDIAQGNLAKLFSRKERGTITGSGDNR